jgi:aspartyl/asparaginyl-tRNA synthetase
VCISYDTNATNVELIGQRTRLTNGCSVRLTGNLVNSQGKGQDKELVVEKCEVVGTCDPDVRNRPIDHLKSLTDLHGLEDVSYSKTVFVCGAFT